jgi:hypothetical protein
MVSSKKQPRMAICVDSGFLGANSHASPLAAMPLGSQSGKALHWHMHAKPRGIPEIARLPQANELLMLASYGIQGHLLRAVRMDMRCQA